MVLVMSTPIATALSRNAAFPVLLACNVLMFANISWSAQQRKTALQAALGALRRERVVVGLVATTVLLGLVSLLWTPSFERGLGAFAQTTVSVCATVFCCFVLARQSIQLGWVPTSLAIAIAAASLVIISEISFGSPIRGALGASQDVFRLNRAAVSVVLFLPLLFLVKGGKLRLVGNIAIASIVLAAAFTSNSESAQLAILLMSATTMLVCVLPTRSLVLLLAFGLVATHVMVPIMVALLYQLIDQATLEAWSAALVGHPHQFVRLEIWWAHAMQIIDAPLFGRGMQAAHAAADVYAGANAAILRGLNYGHPHNISIQVWYELGAVGIALTAVLMVLFFRKVLKFDGLTQKVTLVLIVGIWTVAYISHGAWQHWWWALVGIIVVLLNTLASIERSKRPIDAK
ncbi:MAG: O-antigen ligase family protein [Pseudomonadota bacterium]